jgi:TPR repeat protein
MRAMKTVWIRWLAGWAAALFLLGTAAADPADEHKLGLKSFADGDVVGAIQQLRAPAKAGYAPSQVLLAFILMSADLSEEAVGYYRSAAAQDHPEGHAGLAAAYQVGRGIAKDEKLALQHFSKAADLGHPKSIEIMSDVYMSGGLGVGQAPAADVLAMVRRAAEKVNHLPAIDALAEAYTSGRWGLAPDPALAAQWKAKGAEVRKQRAGAPPPRRGSR